MAQNDFEDRCRKLAEHFRVLSITVSPAAVGLPAAFKNAGADYIQKLSEPDRINLERRLGGRVTG